MQATVLFSDGTESNMDLPAKSANIDDLVIACTALRKSNPSVAEVKVSLPGFDAPYVWSGHYTEEHMEAIVRREKASIGN